MPTLVTLLLGAVLGASGALLIAGGDEERPARGGGVVSAAAASKAPPAVPRCSEVEIPERPAERIACRTPRALLQITGQARPLVVGGTNARVLSARLSGSDVLARVRVRNETRTEQGVQAGGQELYLNVGGRRVDSFVLSAVRVPPGEGRTVRLRYRLSMGEIAALRAADGGAELGVKPWDGSTAPGRVVGVIRMRVRTAATSPARRPPS
jgi:hypothetical protein